MFDTANVEVTEQATPITESEGDTSGFLEGFLGADYTPETTETEGAEESSAPTQEVAAQDTTEQNTSPAKEVEAEDTIPYTYNHTTAQLPKSAVGQIAKALNINEKAVATLLQKGSNYDTLSERQKPYWALISRVNDFAKETGVDTATALSKAIESLDILASNKYVQDIRRQYPSSNMNMVNELARNRAAQAREERLRQEQINRAEAAETERRDKWVSFFRNHADVKSEDLSDRMLQAIANNEDPELVYAQEQNSLLTKEKNDLLQQQSNASRSPGSAKKTSTNAQASDFMSGFWGRK